MKRGRKSGGQVPATEPQPLSHVPEPPAHLGEHGQTYWRRVAPLLVQMETLTDLHIESFATLCEQWQTYRELSDWLHEHPDQVTFLTATGYEAETPKVRMRERALANLQRLWAKFGLTPDALSKLHKGGAAGQEKPESIAGFAASKTDGDPPPPTRNGG